MSPSQGKNDIDVPADESGIMSLVPYRLRVMLIISATVAKVTLNNLEWTPHAWIIGGERGKRQFLREGLQACYQWTSVNRIS